MVVKKVKNPKKSSSKAVRITRLTTYVRAPETEQRGEKCIYANARNFITDTPDGQAAEMIALAEESVRSKDPIVHYVLSWPDGEEPSPDQVDAAVDIYVNELGVPAHQVVYGLHADTDNIHLHIVINRVHPDTCKCIDIGNGFDIETAHRAIARIEHAQGWRPEQRGRYRVLDNGKVERRRAGPGPSDPPGRGAAHQADTAQPLDESSALRIAIKTGAPIIKRARSWEQLHRELAEVGMRYEKTGSGATVFVAGMAFKASQVDRQASLSKLQTRLGDYEPGPGQPTPENPRTAEPDAPKRPGQRQVDREHRTGEKSALRIAIESGAPILRDAQSWEELHRKLAEVGLRYQKTGSGATVFVGDIGVKASSVDRQASLSKLKAKERLGEYVPPAQPVAVRPRTPAPIESMPSEWEDYNTRRQAHYAAKTQDKQALDLRLADERRTLSNAQRVQREKLLSGRWRGRGDALNALRSVIAAEQAAERAKMKERHRAEREQHRRDFRPYPDLKDWQHTLGRPHPAIIAGGRDEPPTPQRIPGFRPAIRGHEVHYTRANLPAGPDQPVSFVDQGKRIRVDESNAEDAVLAALQLAAKKWKYITVYGSKEFKELCARLADEYDFTLTNPELQDTNEQPRQARQQTGNRAPVAAQGQDREPGD